MWRAKAALSPGKSDTIILTPDVRSRMRSGFGDWLVIRVVGSRGNVDTNHIPVVEGDLSFSFALVNNLRGGQLELQNIAFVQPKDWLEGYEETILKAHFDC